jgi:hypothetical protein
MITNLCGLFVLFEEFPFLALNFRFEEESDLRNKT